MVMRAVGLTEFGGPEVLHVIDLPPEPLGPGDVRVRVRAAAVNPTDTMLRSGAYTSYFPNQTFPWIPGMDLAGEVAEVAEGVNHVAAGDLVMAVVTPFGAY